jgi:hypothetical protein
VVATHLAVAAVELESAAGGRHSASVMTLAVPHHQTIQLRERLPLQSSPLTTGPASARAASSFPPHRQASQQTLSGRG